MECTSESLGEFLGILPLRIGAASTKLYIERGADWCGQGKNNSFFEGCGMSTCPYGTYFLDRNSESKNQTETRSRCGATDFCLFPLCPLCECLPLAGFPSTPAPNIQTPKPSPPPAFVPFHHTVSTSSTDSSARAREIEEADARYARKLEEEERAVHAALATEAERQRAEAARTRQLEEEDARLAQQLADQDAAQAQQVELDRQQRQEEAGVCA